LTVASVVGLDGTIDLYELVPEDNAKTRELVSGYEAACHLYERGDQQREAARAFGELVQRFPQDGPSLIMLERSVNQLVEPASPFSPIWLAKSK